MAKALGIISPLSDRHGVNADMLVGGGGADTIFGGDGVDRLEGQDGNDLMEGGAGVSFDDADLIALVCTVRMVMISLSVVMVM